MNSRLRRSTARCRSGETRRRRLRSDCMRNSSPGQRSRCREHTINARGHIAFVRVFFTSRSRRSITNFSDHRRSMRSLRRRINCDGIHYGSHPNQPTSLTESRRSPATATCLHSLELPSTSTRATATWRIVSSTTPTARR